MYNPAHETHTLEHHCAQFAVAHRGPRIRRTGSENSANGKVEGACKSGESGAAGAHHFDPSPAPFMINYIVDDMDALLDRLKQEGVKIEPKRMDESYGRFAWIYDSDGNKIELWQPLPAKP
jgi:predicted enzyme related to lactoylglutathione lyase